MYTRSGISLRRLKESNVRYTFQNRRSHFFVPCRRTSDPWRQGAYEKESHLALIDYMRELGIKRLTAGTALINTPSVALLKSLGFELIETEKVLFYKDAEGNDIVFDGGIFELML